MQAESRVLQSRVERLPLPTTRVPGVSNCFRARNIELQLQYDGALQIGEAWSGPISGSVRRAYDSNFRVRSFSVNDGVEISNDYDGDGLIVRAGDLRLTRDLQNGLVTGSSLLTVTDEWSYNEFGEPTQYKATASAGSTLYVASYVTDSLGRIVTLTQTIGNSTATYTYAYDSSGRLCEVTKDGSRVESYTYDDNGNRTASTVYGKSNIGTFDAQDRVIQYGENLHSYTGSGDLLSRRTGEHLTTYSYDELGNTLGIRLSDQREIVYEVDGLGRRIGKKVNGSRIAGYLYQDNERVAAELDGEGRVLSRFVYSDGANGPSYMVKEGIVYRLVVNHIGSIVLVVNAGTGEVSQQIEYDSFGNVLSDTKPGFQPFGFAGGLYDPDTKLVRFGARDYDPLTGRSTGKDPIGFGDDVSEPLCLCGR